MVVNRHKYPVSIVVNSHHIKTVVIDPHYKIKHSNSITDELILELIKLLDGGDFSPEALDMAFEYYMTDNLILGNKKYRLVWLIEKHELFIGVINAYRRR